MRKIQKERLESLDILRGLDLFILVGFQSVFMYLAQATGENNWIKTIFDVLFTHVEWEGFHLCAYSGGYPFSISGDIRSVPS